jgi:elongation factor G
VAYRETITRFVSKVDYRHVKQTGGHGQFAHVVFEMEPGEPGSGVIFENDIKQGVIPNQFISSIGKGVAEAADSGAISGYPITDIKVRLYDGSFHEVDSSEMAFKIAAIMAFKEGVQRGGAVLLEPVMKVEVVVPEEYIGDVIGQMNSRRGVIAGIEARPGNAQAIRGQVPLAEMFGYATSLRSATQGRGVFTMEFYYYAQVPESVAKTVLGV